LYLDMKTLLPDDMLTKVDRASMAVGLEVRVPLLDYRIVELCAGMPRSLKLTGGRGKVVLRKVVGGWLGPDVADRPKKGFDVPVDAWFRGPLGDLVHGALDCPAAACREWIDPRAISRILRDHERGVRNNGAILWSLLTLELWAQAYVVEPVGQENSEVKNTLEPVEVSA
jgi:asparagine synthase (glutamine-hydrolysing)